VPALPADGSADRPVVLVVNDDATVADTLVEILNQGGYAAIASYGAKDAVETALLVPPDLVIADVALQGMSVMTVATTLRNRLPEVKIVLLSGNEIAADPLDAIKAAGHEFAVVEKPVQPVELLAKVSASLKSRKPDPAVTV
jgi:two-component system catabolic regulation response regulator CreB